MDLDGTIPPGVPVRGYAAVAARDLRHMAERLRDLDRDGTTARVIWPWLCQEQPALAKPWRSRPAAAPLAVEAKAPAPGGAGPQLEAPPADGTLKNARIWLKGKPYRLTQGLRDLLSYLLANPNVSEEQVIKDFGMSSSSHLHKRLKDLRDKLAVELKRSGWRLHIKTEETLISCKWEVAT
jgi:hypothetical protein